MPPSTRRALLLRFDGVVHTSDLPTQAFARHLSAGLPADQVPALIGGMRGFLEGKPELIPAAVDLTPAEDGEQAVEIIAAAFGVGTGVIESARRASRVDLASIVWAVDRADGLDELLEAFGAADLLVWTVAGDPAAAALLDAEEIAVDGVLAGPFDAALASALGRVDADPTQVTVIGTRWAGELELAHRAGCVTVLIDRHGTGRGTPTVRAAHVNRLLPVPATDPAIDDEAHPTANGRTP